MTNFAVVERGWLSANNIVFTQGERTAVVDTGYVSHRQQTVGLVAHALQGRPLDRILNTHLHSDHCGGNAALQAAYPQATIAIPPGHAREVADWDEARLSYQATGQQCERFMWDSLLEPGSRLELGMRDWQVHAAPGHDPHSIILFEPQDRVLISADALWENGFGVIFPLIEGEEAFDEVTATLSLIERLNPLQVIPGHGAPFTDVTTALANARRRLESFVRDPLKHGWYAAKVLIKYRLLDVQQLSRDELWAWADAVPYFHSLHQHDFADMLWDDWLQEGIAALVRAGAARVEHSPQGEQIINLD
jgi:glyoxylase-like metal-dependent hydrolase (beta-lactamase superfamily II)